MSEAGDGLMRSPYRHDPSWWPDSDDSPSPAEPAWPEVEVTDNPVTATLLGPDGSILLELREREPIGFRLR